MATVNVAKLALEQAGGKAGDFYGYESMSVLLDAIKRAGDDGGDRAAVVEQLLGTKDREGVFGTYSFDENGDITLTPYGVYETEDGARAFDRTVTPGG